MLRTDRMQEQICEAIKIALRLEIIFRKLGESPKKFTISGTFNRILEKNGLLYPKVHYIRVHYKRG